jgi:hypothetical protein
MPSERWSVWLAIVAGLATIAAIVWLGAVPPMDKDCLYTVNDIAFELAHTSEEASALFDPPAHVTLTGEKAVACRTDALRMVKDRSERDWMAFVPAYALFLMLGLIAVRSRAGQRGVWLPVAVAVLIAATDVVETLQMLSLQEAGFPAGADMTLLEVSTRIKWLALAVAAVLASWAGWKSRNYLLAVSCIPAVILIPLMCVNSTYATSGGLSLLPSWLLLFATCLYLAWRDSRPQTAPTSANQ